MLRPLNYQWIWCVEDAKGIAEVRFDDEFQPVRRESRNYNVDMEVIGRAEIPESRCLFKVA